MTGGRNYPPVRSPTAGHRAVQGREPRADSREPLLLELLEPTSLTTRCPYKGVASYWSVRVGDHLAKNVVWSYADPIAECPKIRGLLSFFNERVDLYVDGELQPRPRTPWSE